AAARGLDDIHVPADHGIAGQDACLAVRQVYDSTIEAAHPAIRVVDEFIAVSIAKSGNVAIPRFSFERPQEFAKRDLALTAHNKIHLLVIHILGGRESRIVAADDDPRGRSKAPNESNDLLCRFSLKRHHRQADDIRLKIVDELLDGVSHSPLNK